MKRNIFACAMWTMALTLTSWAGILVQDSSQVVFWQSAVDVSRPLVWPWNGADTAKIAYRLPGEAAVTNTVDRESDAAYGSFTLPYPSELASGRQYLYDVSLEVLKSGEVAYSASARVAFLPQAITVLETNAPSWRKVRDIRVFQHDACESPAIETVSSASRTITREQPAASVFAALVPALDVVDRGPFTLSLLDGGAAVQTASLYYSKPLMVLSFR